MQHINQSLKTKPIKIIQSQLKSYNLNSISCSLNKSIFCKRSNPALTTSPQNNIPKLKSPFTIPKIQSLPKIISIQLKPVLTAKPQYSNP